MASEKKFELSFNAIFNCLEKILKQDEEAIGTLIECLNSDKNMTISSSVNYKNIDTVLLHLFKFLQSKISIIVGNSAFILGTLAEHDEGRSKIITIMSSDINKEFTSLEFFVSLLSSNDAETVMNVAGTLGTLVENEDGRHFIISNTTCFLELLIKVNQLLSSDYLWTSSNAALILARLSIDITGYNYIINSPQVEHMLPKLIQCLTFDEAGRGMNAAFALGRIFDKDVTIKRFYTILSKSPFIENLVNIVDSKDSSFMKNACFCLSSIMDSNTGFELVVSNSSFTRLITLLEGLLLLNDDEVVWFCVLTLKEISVRAKGCEILKRNKKLWTNVNMCLHNPILSLDVKSECEKILEYLAPLEKPSLPYITLISPNEVHVSWTAQYSRNGFDLKYQLYYKQDNDEILAYRGKKTEMKLSNLEPNTKYEFYLKTFNEIETSETSDVCIITTDEDYPSEPLNATVLVLTSTQVKLGWDEPSFPNGVIKYYNIHLKQYNGLLFNIIRKYLPKVRHKDKRNIEQTTERVSIISGLQPETNYSISIFAVNSCGKGTPVEIEITTLNSGAHAPCKPTVVVLGCKEVHVTWFAPEAPLGRIFRYDLKLNKKKTIYSGINTYCKVQHLKPDTEYVYSVVAVTSLGKYESPTCKKKTNKDEYASPNREPLYTNPVKPDISDTKLHKKARSMSLVPDQKSYYNCVSEFVNNPSSTKRRDSQPGGKKLLNTRFNSILPNINKPNSFSSSFELQKSLGHSHLKMSSRLINDDILPLHGSQISDGTKSFNRSTVNISSSSISTLVNGLPHSKLK